MSNLNEMWTALERYQPYAEKLGFGDAWRRMCEERTEKSAYAAAWEAWDAAGAAGAAASAAARAAEAARYRWSQYAIENIRKAIKQEQT